MLLDDLTLVLFDLDMQEHRPLGGISSIAGLPGALVRRNDDSLFVIGRHRAKEGHFVVAEVDIVGCRPTVGGVSRGPGPAVGGRGSWVSPVEATRPARGRVRAAARAVAGPPAVRVPVEPSLAADAGVRVDHGMSADDRLTEQRRGYADGMTAAVALPLYALEGLLATSFEIASWLRPWRDHWDRIVAGHAAHGETVPDWLPSIAQFLGVYAAPARVAHAQLTPSLPYVVGFADGLRTAWQDAVRGRLVPPDRETLSQWVRTPLSRPGLPLGLHTITDLRTVAERTRRLKTWKWIGRSLLWLLTLLFCVGEIGAIGATVTGEYTSPPCRMP